MRRARAVAEIRQLSTALESVLAWLGALPGPVTVGLEAMVYWEWLATRLAEYEHGVRVAHAFHVTLIWQARSKPDPINARKLACKGAMKPDSQLPRELEGGEGRAMVADDRVRRRITTPSDFPEELSDLAREFALIPEPTEKIELTRENVEADNPSRKESDPQRE